MGRHINDKLCRRELLAIALDDVFLRGRKESIIARITICPKSRIINLKSRSQEGIEKLSRTEHSIFPYMILPREQKVVDSNLYAFEGAVPQVFEAYLIGHNLFDDHAMP